MEEKFKVGDIVYVKTGCTPYTVIKVREVACNLISADKDKNKDVHSEFLKECLISEAEWLEKNKPKE